MKRSLKYLGIFLSSIGALLVAVTVYLWFYQSPDSGFAGIPALCVSSIQEIQADNTTVDSNCEVRRWYVGQLSVFEALDAQLSSAGVGARGRALCAYTLRHQARLSARNKMQDQVDVVGLRFRDLIKYGHPDGPSFDYLLDKHEGDRAPAYSKIIASARKSNNTANVICDIDTESSQQ